LSTGRTLSNVRPVVASANDKFSARQRDHRRSRHAVSFQLNSFRLRRHFAGALMTDVIAWIRLIWTHVNHPKTGAAHRRESPSPARGVMLALLISLPIWIVAILIIWSLT
jgi:hypothetical protein